MNLDDALAQVSPQVLMDLMQQLIAEAIERTQRGAMPDIAPIERGVGAMCEKIALMPKDEARAFKESLAELMTKLNSLEGMLKQQQAGVAKELQQADLHRKANTAYRSVTHQYGHKPTKPEGEE